MEISNRHLEQDWSNSIGFGSINTQIQTSLKPLATSIAKKMADPSSDMYKTAVKAASDKAVADALAAERLRTPVVVAAPIQMPSGGGGGGGGGSSEPTATPEGTTLAPVSGGLLSTNKGKAIAGIGALVVLGVLYKVFIK